MKIIFGVIFFGIIAGCWAAVVQHNSACPSPYGPGDSWALGNVVCGQCTCGSTGLTYHCFTCGLIHLGFREGCYVNIADLQAPYPDCCHKSYLCRGEPNFDQAAYQRYLEEQAPIG